MASIPQQKARGFLPDQNRSARNHHAHICEIDVSIEATNFELCASTPLVAQSAMVARAAGDE
jgi:hypothetical protein